MTRVVCLAAFAGCLCVGVLTAQAQTSVPQDAPASGQPASPSDAPLLLRYKISQYDHKTKSYSKVDLDKVFQKNDEIIVEIEATEDAFLYVVNEDSNRKVTWISPAADRPEEVNFVKGGTLTRVPAHKNMYFQNDGPGVETLFFLLSRQPQTTTVIERVAIPDLAPVGSPSVVAKSPSAPGRPNTSQPSPLNIKQTFLDRMLRKHPQGTRGQSTDSGGVVSESASLFQSGHATSEPLQKELPRSLGVIEPDHENSFAYVASASAVWNPGAASDVVMWEVRLKQQ